MELFTLIHVAGSEQSIHNNFVTNLKSQILLYLSCARQLAQELKGQGINLHVITNEEEYLRNLMPDYPYPIIELCFRSPVPSGVKFFSAHFKLEVISYLASLNEDYVGLIDSDIACVNDIPYSLKTAIDKKIPLYYDITSQVGPAYGLQNIIENKEKLLSERSIGLWAGGEFISGPPTFFKKLYAEISVIQDIYFKNIQAFHHQGDEMITSIAIEKLKRTEPILDAGALMIIGRFWSVKTRHYQNSINAYSNHFLLHLPSDKRFLINNNRAKMNGTFFKEYKKYLIRKRLFRSVFSGLIPYAKWAITKITSSSGEQLAIK